MDIKNNEIYLDRMKQSKNSKMFWYNEIKNSNVNVIVDYGAGDASMYDWLIEEGYTGLYIAVETNKEFVDIILRKNILVFNDLSFLKNYNNTRNNIAVIFSSVIHEVYSYMRFEQIIYIWNNLKEKNIKYLVFRDMCLDQKDTELIEMAEENNVLSKIKQLHSDLFDIYCSKNKYTGNYKFYKEFLLKYRYVENFSRECEEKYLWFNANGIQTNLVDFECIHKKEYINDWINNKLIEDMGLEFKTPTHYELILKRKK